MSDMLEKDMQMRNYCLFLDMFNILKEISKRYKFAHIVNFVNKSEGPLTCENLKQKSKSLFL